MNTVKCLGLLMATLAWGCSGTELELGVLKNFGGATNVEESSGGAAQGGAPVVTSGGRAGAAQGGASTQGGNTSGGSGGTTGFETPTDLALQFRPGFPPPTPEGSECQVTDGGLYTANFELDKLTWDFCEFEAATGIARHYRGSGPLTAAARETLLEAWALVNETQAGECAPDASRVVISVGYADDPWKRYLSNTSCQNEEEVLPYVTNAGALYGAFVEVTPAINN